MPASTLPELRVDGGMTANELLLQIQADVLGRPVVRPAVTETTALGAAYAAGLAVGFWESLDELRANERGERTWEPADRRGSARARLRRAGTRPSSARSDPSPEGRPAGSQRGARTGWGQCPGYEIDETEITSLGRCPGCRDERGTT